MRSLIFFVFASIFSLTFSQQVYADDQNHPWPFKVNTNLQSPFLNQDSIDYPYNIIQHSDGTLENIEGGATNNLQKQLITADCESNYLPAIHKLKSAEAFLDEKNKLHIVIRGATQSTRELIHLTQVDQNFMVDYQTKNVVFTEKANWQAVKVKIVLATKEFSTNTQLNAYVDLQLEGITRFGSKVHTHIHGYIKPMIMDAAHPATLKLN